VAQHEVETLEELKGKGMKVTVLTPAQLDLLKSLPSRFITSIGVKLGFP
jgi:hypothetical protein